MEQNRPQEKLELATAIAHELQNSLQTIRSLAFVGRDSTESATFRKIERQVEIAQSIVSDVLALGESPLLKIDASLGPLVLAAHAHVRERVKHGHGHGHGTLLLEGSAHACVHAGLFMRVCSILFENAYAWMPQGLVLRVRLEALEASARATITDNGPGVAKDDRARIFMSGVSGRGSTGLGLSIAQSIAEAHQGTLSLTDAPSDGGGASFELTLPTR
jgi:signal transduction histidine kinase